jgi:CrcB protein
VTNAASLSTLLAVALGGAVGSVARYLTTVAFAPIDAMFPLATLAVNVSGAFLIGVFARLFGSTEADPVLRLALTTGLCGGFTTFSAMSAETVTLIQQGRAGRAALYVLLSLVLGFGATAVGLLVARPRP